MPPERTLAALSRELYRLEGALPALAVRREFEDKVQAGQFVVVKGETGSGKSTQLPQYLADMRGIQGQVGDNAAEQFCSVNCNASAWIARTQAHDSANAGNQDGMFNYNIFVYTMQTHATADILCCTSWYISSCMRWLEQVP